MTQQFETLFRRVTTNGFLMGTFGDYAGVAFSDCAGASISVTRLGEDIPKRRKTEVATLSGSETTRYRFPATAGL